MYVDVGRQGHDNQNDEDGSDQSVKWRYDESAAAPISNSHLQCTECCYPNFVFVILEKAFCAPLHSTGPHLIVKACVE